jgi:anti-sigma factor RsiW
MICLFVRRQLSSYLLEELSGAQRASIQEHLDRCPDCAQACEALANHIADLEEALTTGIRTPPDLQERITARLWAAVPTVPWVRRRTRRRRLALPLAIAGVAALLAFGAWRLAPEPTEAPVGHNGRRHALRPSPAPRHPSPLRGVGARHRALSLAALVADHVEFLAKPAPAEFATRDPRAAAGYLSRRLGYPVAAVDLSAEGVTLLGGRKCSLGGVPIAFLFYDCRGARLSLYQLDTRLARLPALAPVPFHGREFRVGRRGPVNLVVWQSGRLMFVLVSNMERSHLLRVAERAAA